MKKLFILALSFVALDSFGVTYWINPSSGADRTLPYITGTTQTGSTDNIVFGMDGGKLTATVTGGITSASSKIQFSGSGGTAGNSTITINEGFTFNMYLLTIGSQNILKDSTVNFTGEGTLTLNDTVDLSNAKNGVAWNFNTYTVQNVESKFTLGEKNVVTLNKYNKNDKYITLSIGSGSKLISNAWSRQETSIDKNGNEVVKTVNYGSLNINNLSINGGSIYVNSGSTTNFKGTSTITSLSEDAYIGYIGLASGTFKVESTVGHKILTDHSNITIWSGGLVLNASNAIWLQKNASTVVSQENIGIECSSGTTSASLTLGADNSFLKISSNRANGVVFTVDLSGDDVKGNVLTLGSFTEAHRTNLILEDFADGLFCVKDDTNFALSMLTVYSDDGKTKIENSNLALRDMGTYFALVQVPEPAEWACVLGAMAIAFAFMRRKR